MINRRDFNNQLAMLCTMPLLNFKTYPECKYKEGEIKLLLCAGVDRNIIVFDADSKGIISDRLLNLTKMVYLRNHPTNSNYKCDYCSSDSIKKLKHIIVSPKGYDSLSLEQRLNYTFHVTKAMDIGGKYYDYYLNTVGGSLPKDKVNLAIALSEKSFFEMKLEGRKSFGVCGHSVLLMGY
jgi:hypothetical protein